jgi:hypothetical protein
MPPFAPISVRRQFIRSGERSSSIRASGSRARDELDNNETTGWNEKKNPALARASSNVCKRMRATGIGRKLCRRGQHSAKSRDRGRVRDVTRVCWEVVRTFREMLLEDEARY